MENKTVQVRIHASVTQIPEGNFQLEAELPLARILPKIGDLNTTNNYFCYQSSAQLAYVNKKRTKNQSQMFG